MEDQSVRNLFAQRKIRCTKQREQVYAALWASKEHPTAEELFHSVRSSAPGISLATIYNALETFTKFGLCRKLAPGQAASGANAFRYDADVHDHAHVLTGSGHVRDLPSDLSDRVIASIPRDLLHEVEQRMGVRIERMNLELVEGPGQPAPEQDH